MKIVAQQQLPITIEFTHAEAVMLADLANWISDTQLKKMGTEFETPIHKLAEFLNTIYDQLNHLLKDE
jgi:hypothetical protein